MVQYQRGVISPLTWLRCLEVQPGAEGRHPHLVDTGDPDAVVRVAPQTRQNLKVRRNQNLLLGEVPPPDWSPWQLKRKKRKKQERKGDLINGWLIIHNFVITSFQSACVCVCYLDDAGGQLRVSCESWFPWQRDVVVHHPQDLQPDGSRRQHWDRETLFTEPRPQRVWHLVCSFTKHTPERVS